MNEADLYRKANSVQRRDAKEILEEFSTILQWKPDGDDSVLDIGCGSGDVTMDFIRPMMHSNFTRLVGADLSDHMIRHARKSYQQPKISFMQMDIAADWADIEVRVVDKFDHITSFYCLHWIQNQIKAVQNIYKLLQPEGDCLVVFLASNPIFDAYKKLSAMEQWRIYMKDVNSFISPYQYSENPGAELGNLFYLAGFSDFTIEVRDRIFVYEGLDLLKRNVKAVNPFTPRMPFELHEKFLDDFITLVKNMGLSENGNNGLRFVNPYKLMVAYARK